MQTRIERYRIYRNEIASESTLIDKITATSVVIQNYKKNIDSLSPHILANINDNKALAKLISINNNKMQELDMLNNFVNLIEQSKATTLMTEIQDWSNAHQPQLIIDDKGNVSKKWLNEDINYKKIASYKEQITNLGDKWSNFQLTSKDQVNKLDQLSKDTENSVVFENINNINESMQNKKSRNKTMYIIPSILSVILLITMIVLVAIKVAEI